MLICLKKGPTNINCSQTNNFLCLSNVKIRTKFGVYFFKVFVDNTCCTNYSRDKTFTQLFSKIGSGPSSCHFAGLKVIFLDKQHVHVGATFSEDIFTTFVIFPLFQTLLEPFVGKSGKTGCHFYLFNFGGVKVIKR